MLEAALIASTFALGLAGAPHCAAMCATPCAVLTGRPDGWREGFGEGLGERWGGQPLVAFHAARAAGYALAGGAAAGGLAGLSVLADAASTLRPIWALVHAALVALGLWLLWQGRQPAWLARLGRASPQTAAGWEGVAGPQPLPTARNASRATQRAGAAGALWFAWPCGLLQSALLVAALANSVLGGAMAMVAFAAASAAGLLWAPWLAKRVGLAAVGRGMSASAGNEGARRRERLALRAAGALIAVSSGWALTAGVWHRVAAYCATLT